MNGMEMNLNSLMDALPNMKARVATVILSWATLALMWAIGLPQSVAGFGGTGSDESGWVLILFIVLTSAVALCLLVSGTKRRTIALGGVMFNVAAFPVLVIFAQAAALHY